jgi:hypothetical protein
VTTALSMDAGSAREAGDDVSIADTQEDPPDDLTPETLESAADTPSQPLDAAVDSGVDVGFPDAPADDNDAPPPPCVERGGIYFARPSTFGPVSLVYGVALAANRDRRVALVFGEPGFTSYVDSLDGGRTLRPLMRLSQLARANMNVSIGPHHVHIASVMFPEHVVTYGTAEIDSFLDPSQLARFNFVGSNYAWMVPNADGSLAVLLRTFGTGSGSFVSVAKTPLAGDFSQPVEVSKGETCAGLWHSSGTLYVAVTFNAARLDIQWSNDLGATFSAPVTVNAPFGQFQCPKLYEQADGNILMITVAGYNTTGEQQLSALTFDHATKQITRTTMVPQQAGTRCMNSVRVSKRTYVTTAIEVSATFYRGNLRYSDDDGATWALPIEVPYLDGAGCTMLAASRDEVYFHWFTAHGDPMKLDRMMHLARLGEMSACE